MKKKGFLFWFLIILIVPTIVNGASKPTASQKATINKGNPASSAANSAGTTGTISVPKDCELACGSNGNPNACDQCKKSHSSSSTSTQSSGLPSSNNTQSSTGTVGAGSAAVVGQNNFECSSCATYSKKDDQRICYISHECALPVDFENNSSSSSQSGGLNTNIKHDYTTNGNTIETTTGCEGVFGEYENGKFINKNSLGYFLQFIFNLIKYAVPIILIVLTIADYVKAVTSGDKDNIKKANSQFIKRSIIAVIIFLLPTILNLILGLVTTHGTCGIK